MQRFYTIKQFQLESGEYLPELTIAYHTEGIKKSDNSNVVWICHALTASSDAGDWWKGVVGDTGVFNPAEHFIICANIIGSAYGTTGPLSVNPETNNIYYSSFPFFTIRDMVKAHELLREHLGIKRIHVLAGASLGGQQAIEWAIENPYAITNLVLIATNAISSPWGIAFRESQRLAIENDSTWGEHKDDAGSEGMKVARTIAMLSYRNYDSFKLFQSENNKEKLYDFKAATYQRYQGVKLAVRFNAYSYHALTKAMDSHNVGRNRGSVEAALKSISARTLVVGISSDILFPVAEQQFIASHIPNATYAEMDSVYGHDGFLVEAEQINRIIGDHFSRSNTIKTPVYEHN